MQFLNDLIMAVVGSPLVLLIVVLLVTADGFFPPVPSETLVVAIAAIAFSTGTPNPLLLVLAAAVGSFAGDNIAYAIGRRLGRRRPAWMRRPKIAGLLQRADDNLQRRAASVILTARFIPVGRVAVNITAGTSELSRAKFLTLTAISAVAWATYSVLIGVLAGAWVRDNPLLGAIVAIALALALGILIDFVITRVRPRRTPRSLGDHADPQRFANTLNADDTHVLFDARMNR